MGAFWIYFADRPVGLGCELDVGVSIERMTSKVGGLGNGRME